MTDLLREYLPTAPDLGLYVAPDIPQAKLRAALADYAPEVDAEDVVALYDATRLGSAKDGAVFLADRLVFQNNDLQPARVVRYEDIVGVRAKRKLLGGREVQIDLNRARATVTETLDFSGQPGAAEYVERFLQQVLSHGVRRPDTRAPFEDPTADTSDRRAVEDALDRLVALGRLTEGRAPPDAGRARLKRPRRGTSKVASPFRPTNQETSGVEVPHGPQWKGSTRGDVLLAASTALRSCRMVTVLAPASSV